MYSKYLIVASKKDIAGINITTALSQFRKNPIISSIGNSSNFDFYLCEEEIIYTENLNLEKINSYDFIIFASKHQSEKHTKTLSIHSPGNFKESNLGGESGKICPSSALFQKKLFENLNNISKEYDMQEKYEVTLECTHHGPLIDKPCVFIEIGSTEEEWKNRKAAFIIAKTISETIEKFKENPYHEIVIGIGGPHYCPNFNKIQLNSNYAISHIISGYNLPFTESMFLEAIEKTVEEVDLFILDWKGLPNSEERERIIEILDKNYMRYKKTKEIKKN
jgi:D-aminoacyl-tRNA deacylase